MIIESRLKTPFGPVSTSGRLDIVQKNELFNCKTVKNSYAC